MAESSDHGAAAFSMAGSAVMHLSSICVVVHVPRRLVASHRNLAAVMSDDHASLPSYSIGRISTMRIQQRRGGTLILTDRSVFLGYV